MAYKYEELKEFIFTDEGQRLFLKVRDKLAGLLNMSGAASIGTVLDGIIGDSWEKLACIDRLIELGEIVNISPENSVTQNQILTRP